MLIFWILTGLACALAGWIILNAARASGRPMAAVPDKVVRGAALQRDYDELDRMTARGVLSEEALATARTEVALRHLQAPMAEGIEPLDAAAQARQATLVLAGIAATVLVALGVYFLVGKPGEGDQPYAVRVAEWAETPGMLNAEQRAAVMAREARAQPDSFEVQALLGAARFEAGDAIGAASALRRAAALKPEDAQTWARLGEALVQTQDGVIGSDAEMAFERAIELDPDQLGARYFLGELALQRGEAARVHELWGPLIAVLAPNDARRADLEARLPPLTGGGN